jgi:hypothetical protein
MTLQYSYSCSSLCTTTTIYCYTICEFQNDNNSDDDTAFTRMVQAYESYSYKSCSCLAEFVERLFTSIV